MPPQVDPYLEQAGPDRPWRERVYQVRLLLRRYWWILFLTVSLGIAWNGYTQYQAEPEYVSTAQMIVSGRIALPDSVGYREEVMNFFGTQINLMTSQAVQERAHARVKALRPELTRSWVTLNAQQRPETTIFLLRARGGDAQYTQAFLDAVMEEYLNFRREMRQQTSESTLLAITEQLMGLEEQIVTEEEALVEFQKQNNLVFLQEQGTSAGAYLARLKNSQAELKTQLLLLETLGLQQSGTLLDEKGEELLEVGGTAERDEPYLEARRQLSQVLAERDAFAVYLKPKHPKMIGFNQEIERLRHLLNITQRQALDQLSERKEVLRKKMDNLDVVIAQWETVALENSRLSAEHEQLSARLERSRATHQRLLDSIQRINLTEQIAQEMVEPFARASVATEIRVNMTRKLIEGGVLGFIVGCGVLFLLASVDNRVITAEDLKRKFEHPVLGLIPFEQARSGERLGILQHRDPRHLFAEAMRTLRSSLLFMKVENRAPTVILVTSAVPAEGKSTIATNLAAAIAMTSAKTILVDADLRRGRIAKDFGLSKNVGVGDYLSGKAKLEECIQATTSDNLSVIATGEYPERPGELLISPSMDRLLGELRGQFEYVVVDSAPILATDDTSGFAGKSDAVLFAVRAGHTQMDQVRSAVDRLLHRGAHMSGFVLNFVDTRGSDYYYYKRYHGYYSYAPKEKGAAS